METMNIPELTMQKGWRKTGRWEGGKAKEAEKAAEEKKSGTLSEPQDEYISSEKSGKKPTGLYWVGKDENGSRKIFLMTRKLTMQMERMTVLWKAKMEKSRR